MKLPDLKLKAKMPVVAMGDIAFLLLVFFLVTSALDQSRKLEIEIPSVKNITKIPQEEIFNIFIDKDGKIYFKGSEKNLFEIQFLYFKHISLFKKPIIQIVADKNLPFEKVDEILQTLRKNTEVKVAFSCKEEKDE
ncbi:MAG: biopolymer transporter ExbD [Brevinematales bacterium]|nr:biopolymer transporter ExbD [Brevinematales bacterium]